MTQQQQRPLPPEAVTPLLARARQIQQQGNDAGARTVLRALSARAPGDTRVWAMLAVLAETRAERHHALSQLVAIDPTNQAAQQALARLNPSAPPASEQPAPPAIEAPPTLPMPQAAEPPVASAPTQHEEAATAAERRAPLPPRYSPSQSSYVMPPASLVADVPVHPPLRRQARWPLFFVLGMGALITIALFLLVPRWQRGDFAFQAAPTPALLGGVGAGASAVPSLAPTTPPTMLPTQPPPPAATNAIAATSLPVATTPISVTADTLQPGDIAQQGIWTASLLDSAYARVLDGSIGELQPQGRFLLAMMVINNSGTTPAILPEDFFTLTDTQGQSYRSRKVASTTFLDTFGRGQYGDVSLEDEIPAGVNVTVPVIFDVPEGTSGLQLRVGKADIGWAMPTP